MKGVIVDVRPVLSGQRLRVVARVRTEECGPVDAYLPDREVAAFLPRSLLVGESRAVPRDLLGTIAPILRRFVAGRQVRLWQYESATYFSFPSWRSVKFRPDGDASDP